MSLFVSAGCQFSGWVDGVRMRSKVEVMVVVDRGFRRLVSGGVTLRKGEESYGGGLVGIGGNPCRNSQWRCF